MHKKAIVGGTRAVLFGAALLAVFLLYSSPVPTKPPVVYWESSAIVQDVLGGNTITTTVSFTAAKNLTHVVVRKLSAACRALPWWRIAEVFLVSGEAIVLNMR
jgi:hypothetical protein